MTIPPTTLFSNVTTLVNLLTTEARIDVVAILQQDVTIDPVTQQLLANFTQLFSAARPMAALVRETAKVMDYPVETGAIFSDHRISNPTEIEMRVIIPQEAYTTAYAGIRAAWQNATLLSVQTRTGTYRNMIIADLPHTETEDMYSACEFQLRLREIILSIPSSLASNPVLANFAPANPRQANPLNAGLLTGVAAAGTVLGALKTVSVFGGII